MYYIVQEQEGAYPNVFNHDNPSKEFYQGRKIKQVEFVIELMDLDRLPDVWHCHYWIFSRRAVEILSTLQKRHIQIIQAVLRTPWGDEDRSFFAVHILRSGDITCFDWKASEYDCIFELLTRVRRFVIDPSRIPSDRHFFRIDGSGFCMASEALRDRFISAGITGIHFVRPEDVNDYIDP